MKIAMKRSVLAALLLATTTSAEDTCFDVRTSLAGSYITDVYDSSTTNNELKQRTRSFNQAWKRLSRGQASTCEDAINARAFTDLVKVCDRAGLEQEGCEELMGTLIMLTTPDDGASTEGVGDELSTETFCKDDAMMCDDGRFVGRDPKNDCEFFPCPPSTEGASVGGTPGDELSTETFCKDDTKMCDDGRFVGRDPKNDCEFFPCPSGVGTQVVGGACPTDVIICDDGSYVSRDAKNDCQFPSCPSSTEGASVGDIPVPADEFVFCTQEVKTCPDGITQVGRNSANGCAFHPCPPSKGGGGETEMIPLPGEESGRPDGCRRDSVTCPNGVTLQADENCFIPVCKEALAFSASNGEECPCAGSINSIFPGDALSENSCQNSARPVINLAPTNDQLFPIGSFASFDVAEDSGECADGDAIFVLNSRQGQACVEQIEYWCGQLGHPIPCDGCEQP